MSGRWDTFMDRCLRGEVTTDAIDDFVDAWHASADEASLAAFLGMTEAEYAQWVRDPGALASIVGSRRDKAPLMRVGTDR